MPTLPWVSSASSGLGSNARFCAPGVNGQWQNYLFDILMKVIEPYSQNIFIEGHWAPHQGSTRAHLSDMAQNWAKVNIFCPHRMIEWSLSSPALTHFNKKNLTRFESIVWTSCHKKLGSLKWPPRKPWAFFSEYELRPAIINSRSRLQACMKAGGDFFEN